MDKKVNMERSGKVWLVGAGPGDAGLLTVKAKELFDYVDVIVYDALVSVEILSQIPEKVQLIYVGKRSGHHPIPQEEISRILLQQAQVGKNVLRLKGGDPFVFGRGGEEIELLVEEGIPVEVVPGVTSAVAVPAYAGIPVTHRDYTSSFHIVTGHAQKDGSRKINYKALVSMDATLVFLMGVSSMSAICDGLLDAGISEDMPAAILEKGTTAKQRNVISTVSCLCKDAGKAEIKAPAIILVGRVCALGEVFHWAENQVLSGRQFLITRPRQNNARLSVHLRKLGAHVIELPSIRTVAISSNSLFADSMERFAQTGAEAWLVFTSPIGVDTFFEQLEQLHLDVQTLFRRKAQVRVAATGSATARRLRSYGWKTDVVPEVYCASELGKAMALKIKPDSKVVIVRAKEGSKELIPQLQQMGVPVEDIPMYETVYEVHEQIREKLIQLYADGEIDAVTFTSASTVHGFVNTMKEMDYSGLRAICIGEQTAEAARTYQMHVTVSAEASIESMVEKIIQLYARES